MEQTMIYDYLGRSDDPLFERLSKLEKGQRVILNNAEIVMNIFGLYEIETDEIHEGFSNISDCYNYLCDELNTRAIAEVGGE